MLRLNFRQYRGHVPTTYIYALSKYAESWNPRIFLSFAFNLNVNITFALVCVNINSPASYTLCSEWDRRLTYGNKRIETMCELKVCAKVNTQRAYTYIHTFAFCSNICRGDNVFFFARFFLYVHLLWSDLIHIYNFALIFFWVKKSLK